MVIATSDVVYFQQMPVILIWEAANRKFCNIDPLIGFRTIRMKTDLTDEVSRTFNGYKNLFTIHYI